VSSLLGPETPGGLFPFKSMQNCVTFGAVYYRFNRGT
jgi:hypothetical protein